MRIRFLALLLALAPFAANAGNMDSHLTATHHLARLAGLSEEEARLIASADWSMDLYARTEALPHVSSKGAFNDGLYHAPKGYTYHSLGGSPEEVHARLEKMHKVITGDTDRTTKLRHIGQYLHALQDVYFHAKPEGGPYEPFFGHLLGGHDTDKVALHFDGALRAYRETLAVMKALAAGDTVPPPPAKDRLYTTKQLQRSELDMARADGTMALASAIARSYEPTLETVAQYDGTATVPGGLEPNEDKLAKSLAALLPGVKPFVRLNAGDRDAIDYNENPQLLVIQPEDPYPDLTKAADAAAKGVSFTAAAANAIPLDVDLDGFRFENGELVLSGKSGGSLDAALVLTALRLACRREDPYFSLDAVDPGGFTIGAKKAYEGFEARKSELLRSGSDDGDASIRVFSPRELEAARFEALRTDPAMQTALVFDPPWLAQTRFGARMYEADVALKEMAAGLDVTGNAPRMPGDEPPGVLRMAARAMVEPDSFRTADAGTRLWFALPGQSQTTWDFYVPDFSIPGVTRPMTTTDLVRRRLAEKNLVGDGHLATHGGTAIVQASGVDLSSIVPVAHVRLHDIASGQDRAGNDPALADLADALNSRFGEFAAAHPAVDELREILRAYVLAVHVAKNTPAICNDVDLSRIPLLASERVPEPLPATREPLFVLASISMPLAYTNAGGEPVHETYAGIAGVASGGVTLGGRESLVPGAQTAIGRELTAGAIARGASNDWRTGDRRFLAMRLDLADAAKRFGAFRFVPVTEEDVLAGRVPAAAAATRPVRSALASRWIGVIAALLFALLGNAAVIAFYRRKARA